MTTEPKHTPGPWRIEKNVAMKGFNHLAIVNRDHPDWFVCSVTPMEIARERDYANAALIASAPSLLAENERLREACQSILNTLDWAAESSSIVATSAVEKCRAALSATEKPCNP